MGVDPLVSPRPGPSAPAESAELPSPTRVPRNRTPPREGEYVSWEQVETFLVTARRALDARRELAERLAARVEELEDSSRKTESLLEASQEETRQLADMVESLMSEKATLSSALATLERHKAFLQRENGLLRAQLCEPGGGASTEVSPQALSQGDEGADETDDPEAPHGPAPLRPRGLAGEAQPRPRPRAVAAASPLFPESRVDDVIVSAPFSTPAARLDFDDPALLEGEGGEGGEGGARRAPPSPPRSASPGGSGAESPPSTLPSWTAQANEGSEGEGEASARSADENAPGAAAFVPGACSPAGKGERAAAAGGGRDRAAAEA